MTVIFLVQSNALAFVLPLTFMSIYYCDNSGMVEQLPGYEVFDHYIQCGVEAKFVTVYKISLGVLTHEFKVN